jgi:predicted transcriptional regulator
MTPQNFKHIRKNVLQSSQRKLSETLGCSRFRIIRMEQGRAPIIPETKFAMYYLAMHELEREV